MKKALFILLLIHSLPMMAQQKKELSFKPTVGAPPTFLESQSATTQPAATPTISNKQVIKLFLEEVRSGKAPERASNFMAETVLAHQLNSENETSVKRTPQNYADHVREFLKIYGNYTFQITELLADGNKVYARWKQTGTHRTEIDGYPATQKPLVEIASAVYRLEDGKIVEYWIQIDRLGMEEQLKQHAPH